MKKPEGKSRGTIFWKNLGLILLITCIPISFIGAILYAIGTSRIEAEVNKAHQNQLSLSIQQLNDYLINLEHSVVRLAFDKSLDDMLKDMDLVQEFSKTNELMKTLSLITESNSLIDSVALYLRDANKLIGDEVGFQSIQTDEDRKLLNALLDKERTIYWDYALRKVNQPESRNKAIIVKLPGAQMYGSYGAFLIYLDQIKLNTLVDNLVSGEGVAFLFNEHGDFLTTPPKKGESTQQLTLEGALRKRIMEENVNDSMFKFDWQHQTYTVSYGKIAKMGGKWTVVSATPMSQITAPVTFLSRLILWISIVGLIIGLLLSWFASNKMYAPIYRLKKLFETSRNSRTEETNEIIYIENQWKQHLEEQQALALRIKQSIPALRESFILQFLQGNLYTHTVDELNDKMRQLDWDVKDKRFVVMVAQLHGLSELGGKFTERDAQLITFAASNIILELCSEKLKMAHVINFQDLSAGVFFVLDKSYSNEEIKAVLNKLAHDYIAAVNNVLRLKITIVMGRISDSILEMPGVLDQTRKALRFRDLHTSNQMLDMNQFMMEPTSQKHFPSELERDIVHAVSMGLEEEAVRLIKQFMLELQSNNSTELMVHQGMMKLLGTLHDTIIKHDVNLYTLYEGVHLYEELMQLSEPDQIIDWFHKKLIHPFVRTLSITYDSHMREIIDKLMRQIQKDIFLDISLDMYAEQLELSASKLSKAFKHIHGTNFIDFVIRLKIEKCKELLVTSDMKINDIAELLHYQPSHLIRIFKKSEGMTPRQYREKITLGNPADSSA